MEAAVAAVALGAAVVEKHFTLDTTMAGPDHKASINARQLKEFVGAIRRTERLLGDGIKRPTPSELRNIDGIRRSVVARAAIRRGTPLSAEMLTCKRPGGGIPPRDLETVVGMRITRDLEEDEPLRWEYLR
jgi:N-acetylneuraminate synthase/N,N'-diacetyllegionaminate synthase